MDRLVAARQLRKALEMYVATLSDAEALQVASVSEAWATGTTYAVGDRRTYNDVLYKCLQAHTSQDTWTPDTAASLWAKVLIPDSTVTPEWVQPDSTNPYALGDKVTHNGKTWTSTVANNVWEPGAYGWEEQA